MHSWSLWQLTLVCLLGWKEVQPGPQTWSNGRPRVKVNDDVIKLFLVHQLVILGSIGKCILGQWPIFSNPLTYICICKYIHSYIHICIYMFIYFIQKQCTDLYIPMHIYMYARVTFSLGAEGLDSWPCGCKYQSHYGNVDFIIILKKTIMYIYIYVQHID